MSRKFQLTFECENEVFDDDLHKAIADALVQAARRVRVEGDLHGLVRDMNGNTIGAYDLVNDRS